MLAYGDLKRVEVAIALAHRPRLLLMDEPTAGMAPGERLQLMALVRELARAESLAVLFTEHDMDVVFAHADRIMVMNRGELIADGTPDDGAGRPGGSGRLSRDRADPGAPGTCGGLRCWRSPGSMPTTAAPTSWPT